MKFLILLGIFLCLLPIAYNVQQLSAFSKPEGKNQVNKNNTAGALETIPDFLQFPANLLRLDEKFSHHILIVEKSTHRLHLYYNDNGFPRYIKSYPIVTGKTSGNKKNKGDRKTPEGIYQLVGFLSEDNLFEKYGEEGKQYGIGAFVLNYPNAMDIRNQKTGGGVWLHSTDEETRISKGLDSRGCVVVANSDLRDISQYVELNSSQIVIVQDLYFLREETWSKNQKKIEKKYQQMA